MCVSALIVSHFERILDRKDTYLKLTIDFYNTYTRHLNNFSVPNFMKLKFAENNTIDGEIYFPSPSCKEAVKIGGLYQWLFCADYLIVSPAHKIEILESAGGKFI